MKLEIAECCRRLRLSRNIAEICDRVQAESHEEYLLQILRYELAYREAVRKGRLLKQAGFYTLKTFDGYCFDEIRIPSGLSIDKLKDASFIEERRNLILYGNVGTGKTHLAIAVGVAACQKGKAVRFFRTAALVNQLSEAQKMGTLNQFLKQLFKLKFETVNHKPLENTAIQDAKASRTTTPFLRVGEGTWQRGYV